MSAFRQEGELQYAVAVRKAVDQNYCIWNRGTSHIPNLRYRRVYFNDGKIRGWTTLHVVGEGDVYILLEGPRWLSGGQGA